jgi:hypothetical protein
MEREIFSSVIICSPVLVDDSSVLLPAGFPPNGYPGREDGSIGLFFAIVGFGR